MLCRQNDVAELPHLDIKQIQMSLETRTKWGMEELLVPLFVYLVVHLY